MGLALVPCATHADAQGLEGYYYGPTVELPRLREEGTDSSRFHLSIVRTAPTEWGRELIARAERLYPSPTTIADSLDAILAGAGDRGRAWREGFAEAAAAAEEAASSRARWWWLWSGEFALPYALTGATVAEYLTAYERLRDGPNPYDRVYPGASHRAELTYVSTVEALGSGYVVVMSMRWSFRCGSLCGIHFQHFRRVEFDAEGAVVRVEGDRPPHYVLS